MNKYDSLEISNELKKDILVNLIEPSYKSDIAEEYTFRYNRVHSCEKHIIWLNQNLPNFKIETYKYNVTLVINKKFEELGMTPIPLAMPDESKRNDPIKSYRTYYINSKSHFTKWTNRLSPWWFHSKCNMNH